MPINRFFSNPWYQATPWIRSPWLYILIILIVWFTFPNQASAQSFSGPGHNQTDTLISMVGKVLNSKTKEPITAKLTFHRLPYGGNVGISNVKNNEGDYQLTLMKSHQYTVKVEADGYVSVNEVVNVEDISNLGKILKDFFLIPTEVGQLLRLRTLIFEQSETNITTESYAELNELVKMLKERPKMVIQLEGHTDYKGRASLNMQLSQDRVEAVKDYLVSKGIKPKRIKLKAFGGSKPISRANSDNERRENRRVEVRILEI